MSGSALWIDTHNHPASDAFFELLESVGGYLPGGAGEGAIRWEPQRALEELHEAGVSRMLLSFPPISGVDQDDGARLARSLNDLLADMVSVDPSRFGAFAVLPWTDPANAVLELERSIDELGLDGVSLISNTHGRYPGDPRLRPVWEAVADRSACVFLHPSDLSCTCRHEADTPPSYLMELPFDSTRAVFDLVASGVLSDHPEIALVVAHAGGTVPFLAGRLATSERTVPAIAENVPEGVLNRLSQIYVDTALSANRFAIPAATELVGTDHIVFGTDYPYFPATRMRESLRFLEDSCGFSADALEGLASGNILRAMPALARRWSHAHDR